MKIDLIFDTNQLSHTHETHGYGWIYLSEKDEDVLRKLLNDRLAERMQQDVDKHITEIRCQSSSPLDSRRRETFNNP